MSSERDIVERLQAFDEELLNVQPWTCEQTAKEAAEEIVRLREQKREAVAASRAFYRELRGCKEAQDAMAREIERLKEEATIAWSVCASVHREWASGKDPFFKTRQADFVRHENEARSTLTRSIAS